MRKRFLLLIAFCVALFGCVALGACGISKKTSCEHPNATAQVTQAATCTEAGVRTYTCPDCAKTWTETIAATGHSYAKDAERSQDATCGVAGKTVYVCGNCGDFYEDPVAALTHNYVEDTASSVKASCTTAGKTVKVCANCGDEQVTELPATGHNYVEDTSSSVAATCTTAGKTVKVCANCKDVQETPIAAAGHVWEGAVCAQQSCKNCDATRPATEQHHYVAQGAPYEKEEGVYDRARYCHGDLYTDYECSVCHDRYSTLTEAAALHSVEEWQDSGELTKKAGSTDCTYEGKRTGTCAACGQPAEEVYEVKDHHTYVTVIKEAATCKTPGTLETRCADCGTVKETKPYTDDNAHKWDEGRTEGGVTTFTCANDQSHTRTAIVAEAGQKTLGVTKENVQNAQELVVGDAAIEMDANAKNALPEGELTFGVDVLDENKIDEGLREQLKGKEVYDITLGADGEPVTQFSGKVTVRIPYELKEGEDVEAIVIWYVNGEKIESVEATYSNGYVTFETEHFSYYTVGMYTPEEMCSKYGCNMLIQQRDATCVLNGYDIEVCTRCGKVYKNEVIAAQGHMLELVEAECTDASCTEQGREVRKCSACDYKTTKILPATGHSWTKSPSSTEANCQHAGSNIFTCENCAESYTESIPQTRHSYQAAVTEATCTAGGYTTYTCSVCQDSYTDDFTQPAGHSWNIPAPTCTEDRYCTVCGEEGGKATGHSYGDGGFCTVCGEGCTHQWQKGEVVPSTCTEKGYTVYTCSVCHISKHEDETPLTDHTYGDNGKCTHCGATAPAVVSEYEKLIRSLKAEKYSVTAEEIAVHILSESSYSDKTDVTISEFEGALQLTKEGAFALHLSGSAHICNQSIYSLVDERVLFDIVLVDATVYMKLDQNGEESISRIPTEVIMSSNEGPMSAILGILMDPEALSGMLEQISAYGDTIVSVLEKLCAKIFVRSDTADGFEYKFDNAKVLALNDDLYTLPVAECIDTYFGEGAFEKFTSSIRDLLTVKTIPQAIDAIVEKAEAFGLDQKTLFGLADSLLAMISQGEGGMTIEQLYSSEQFAELTLAAMIEQGMNMEEGAFAKQLDGMLDMLKSAKGYELLCTLFSSMGGGSQGTDTPMPDPGPMPEDKPVATAEEGQSGPTPELLHTIVEGLFGEDAFVFTFLTDKESAVKSVGLTLALDLDLDFGGDKTSFSLTGSVNIGVGAGEDIAEPDEYGFADEVLSELTALVKASSQNRFEIGRSYFYLDENGALALKAVEREEHEMNSMEDEEGRTVRIFEVYEYVSTFGDLTVLQLAKSDDCANMVAYTFTGEAHRTYAHLAVRRTYQGEEVIDEEEVAFPQEDGYEYDTTASFTFYYDTLGKEYLASSGHTFVLDPTQSGNEEDTPCEGSWDDVYVCDKCGKKHIERHYKSHETYTEVTLLHEGTSCLEGIVRKEICSICKQTLRTEIVEDPGYHETWEKSFSFDTPHGEATFTYRGCACGEYAMGLNQEPGSGCYFDKNEWEDYPGHVPEGHTMQMRRCGVEGCGTYMVVDRWGEKIGCTRYEYEKYTFFNSDNEPLGDAEGYRMIDYWEEHDIRITERSHTDYDFDRYGYSGSRIVEDYVYVCGHEQNYTHTHEVRYDRYDRVIYELQITQYSDGREEYYARRCEYDENCFCTEYVKHSPDDEERPEWSGIRHAPCGWYVGPTCSQFGYYDNVCPVCGMGEKEERELPLGHEYNSDGYCDRCGLGNGQGTDGIFTLEDLTLREDTWGGAELAGNFVVGVWDKRDLGEQTVYSFDLIYLDENGEEQEVRISLEYDIVFRAPNTAMEFNCYLLTVSQADVAAAISSATAQAGWQYQGLRVSFVPAGTATGQVVSITLTND